MALWLGLTVAYKRHEVIAVQMKTGGRAQLINAGERIRSGVEKHLIISVKVRRVLSWRSPYVCQ